MDSVVAPRTVGPLVIGRLRSFSAFSLSTSSRTSCARARGMTITASEVFTIIRIFDAYDRGKTVLGMYDAVV